MSLLDRYIVKHTLKSVAIAFLILFSLIALIDFFELNRKWGDNDGISTFHILQMTSLKMLSLIEEAIPFVVLFGIIGALYSLNRQSELVIMRASGLSAWRYLRPVFLTAIGLGVFWTSVLNPLASHTMNMHEKQLESLGIRKYNGETVWLREGDYKGQTLIHADYYAPKEQRFDTITITQFSLNADNRPEFKTRYDAKKAYLLPSRHLKLIEVKENSADLRSRNTEYDSLVIPTSLQAEDIKFRSPQLPNFWKLPEQIEQLKLAGFSSTKLNLRWHNLLSLPLMLLAMAFIAACISMRHIRQGGVLRLMVTGITIGFLVFFANSVFSAFGESSTLPISVAVWIVPIMTLFLGATYLSKVEDG